MNYSLNVTIEDAIALVRLNRPEAANALNGELLGLLLELFEKLGNDPSVRGVVITGEGKHFCAGADIGEMAAMDEAAARIFVEQGQRLMFAIEEIGLPVLAAVNGHAAGGGLELALACDYIIAAESAVFAAPEVKLGIIPGFGGSQRLSRLIGKARAKEMIFTGMGINARVACAIGLVNTIYPDSLLVEAAVGVMKDMCCQSPVALRRAKEIINAGQDMDLAAACAMEADAFGDCFATPEGKAGMNDFLEKRRKPITGDEK